MGDVRIHPEVGDALSAGRPVVALESAVLTHGLPRTPVADCPPLSTIDDLDTAAPVNLEACRAMQCAVREAGAVPATIAVVGGDLRIGLEPAELERLAADESAEKASVARLAALTSAGGSAGLTVSATLVALPLATPEPIRVLATGGIGGVHQGWRERPDVSADLAMLAETPACVVCAGAKSILDVDATIEALETAGVPVVGYGTDVLPRFHAPGRAETPVADRVDDAAAVARLCRGHWETLERRSAVVIAAPVPAPFGLSDDELDAAIEDAARAADAAGVVGAARTPFLLDQLAARTGGRSLRANVALLRNNAALAAGIASALAGAP